MQIWRDDFRFDKMCEDDEDGVPEEEEMDDADDEIDEEAYDPWDDEEIENFPWGQQSHSKKPAEKNAHLPRFCAKFHFAVVEGVMRIVPPESTRQQFPKTFLIKNNRCFEYIWRGRETGEGEIQIPDEKPKMENIEFIDHATMLRGVFECPFMEDQCHFTGVKLTHGRGKLHRSEDEWAALSGEAWSRGCVSRWR